MVLLTDTGFLGKVEGTLSFSLGSTIRRESSSFQKQGIFLTSFLHCMLSGILSETRRDASLKPVQFLKNKENHRYLLHEQDLSWEVFSISDFHWAHRLSAHGLVPSIATVHLMELGGTLAHRVVRSHRVHKILKKPIISFYLNMYYKMEIGNPYLVVSEQILNTGYPVRTAKFFFFSIFRKRE